MAVLHKVVFLSVASVALATTAIAAEDWSSRVQIPQLDGGIPKSEAKVGDKEREVLKESDLAAAPKVDYQTQVINNPKYTEYGRAQAAIKMNEDAVPESGATLPAIKQDMDSKILSEDQLGANIAVIRQEGSNNSSTVVQTGKNNKAVQTQKGEHNDIALTQKGDKNESYEEQVGKYNHKKKIQNGIVTETEENN